MTARSKMRSSSYRLGLRPGSVRLRSRALDLRLSRALAADMVPRPPRGLSPRAHCWGRAPPPSRATRKCARFAGSFGDGQSKKVLRNQTSSFFSFFLLRYPCCCDIGLSPSFDIFCISRPRGRYRFSSLDYHPGWVAFGLLDPFCISSLGYEYGTTAQAAAVFCATQTRLGYMCYVLIFQHIFFNCCVRVRDSGRLLFFLFFVHEIGRKSDFPQAKFPPHRYSMCQLIVNL